MEHVPIWDVSGNMAELSDVSLGLSLSFASQRMPPHSLFLRLDTAFSFCVLLVEEEEGKMRP